jgi:hypothetical protein
MVGDAVGSAAAMASAAAAGEIGELRAAAAAAADGISVMGYADLPTATSGSALYVLAFEANGSSSTHHATEPDASSPPTRTHGQSIDAADETLTEAYSVWSLAGPASLVFPVKAGSCYRVVDMLGETRPGQSCAKVGGQLRVDNVTDAPLIVVQLAEAT